MRRRQPGSTPPGPLFPYTTLFRSNRGQCLRVLVDVADDLRLDRHRLAERAHAGVEARLRITHPRIGAQRRREIPREQRGELLVEPIDIEIDRLRSEEHTSELQSLMRNSYAVFCLKQKTTTII